ncbi:MAG: hypothetical protein LUQ69_04045, partial [Methanoregulaceae archaeon]|nr:hypothetical protein [Methanoregulaceae archaeon]
MPSHTKGKLKSDDSGFRKGKQTHPDTPAFRQQKVKGIKTENKLHSQLSETDTRDLFTDSMR